MSGVFQRMGSWGGVLLSAAMTLASLPLQAQTTNRTVTYTCAGNRSFQVEYASEVARFTADPGQTFALPQVPSASGARYSNGRITLFTQGNGAFVEVRGQRLFDQCVAQGGISQPPNPSPTQPTAFRYNCISALANFPERRNVTLQEAERLVVQRDGGNFIYRCQLISTTTLPNPGPSRVSGTVSYRERIALSNNAVVEVELQDVSRQDVAATVIARQVIPTQGQQVPIPFELIYNPVNISDRNTYAVRAQIFVGGRLEWTSTQTYPVITRGNPTENINVLVQRVR